MSRNVNPRRSYDASGRRARAEQTRGEIVSTARRLFEERGYSRTTIAEVARAANVSPETIYKAFSSKGALLGAVVRAAIRGDAAETPFREGPEIEAIRREPDPGRQLEMYGAIVAAINLRLASLDRMMREAAPAEPDIAHELERLRTDRLDGMTEFAALLAGRGHLRAGVSRQEARDVLWSLNSPELYDLMVLERGWSPRRYGRWIGSVLRAMLL